MQFVDYAREGFQNQIQEEDIVNEIRNCCRFVENLECYISDGFKRAGPVRLCKKHVKRYTDANYKLTLVSEERFRREYDKMIVFNHFFD